MHACSLGIHKIQITAARAHELTVTLDAPTFLEPGESSLLNATVYNRGLNNETDVDLFLLINETEVNHVTIPELVNGTSYTIDNLWTPTVKGIYNLTAYAPPVPGENFIANNWCTMYARVESVPVISLNPMEYTAWPGESFTIDVYITDVTGLFGCAVMLGYNNTLLEAVRVHPTDITDDATKWLPINATMQFNFDSHPVINNTRTYAPDYAYVWVFAWDFTSFTGSGALFTIEFTAIAVGSCALDLFMICDSTIYPDEVEVLDIWSDPIDHIVLDGSVTVVPPRALTIYSSPSGVTFTVDGISHTTPWSGTYSENTSVNLKMPEIHTVGDARYYWDQWSDGVTTPSRTVTMTTNVTLTAYYTGPYYELTVTSSPITGIIFTINGTPQTTPYTKWLLEGSYTLEMPETHDAYSWFHWLEDGDTNRIKTVTMNTNITLTAVFAAPPTVHEVVWDSEIFAVTIETPSFISDFAFNQPCKLISFNVTGLTGTIGSCNVTIPKQLLGGEPWMVKIGGLLVPFVETENETHTFLYFTYAHSIKAVEIVGTNVIPEFPSAIILPLFTFFTLIAVALAKKIRREVVAKTL